MTEDIGNNDPDQLVPATAVSADPLVLVSPIFISDLHLAEDAPQTVDRFLRFLTEQAASHSELLILGDLLEYWAGDDDLDAQGTVAQTVVSALREYADGGHAVFLMHGNRDLLVGRRFAVEAGAKLLADPVLANIQNSNDTNVAVPKRALLAHGDAWCTGDMPYMAFRAQARNPGAQKQFLSRPLPERKAFIGAARAHSESRKRETTMEIMDVTPEAVAEAMIKAQVDCVIHGHTHRPAIHALNAGGVESQRCVLPDWDYEGKTVRGGFLRFEAGQPMMIDLPA